MGRSTPTGSPIGKQLQQYQESAKASAEWNDLVSAKEIAEKIGRFQKRANELPAKRASGIRLK